VHFNDAHGPIRFLMSVCMSVFRANIWALKEAGCTVVLASMACGSLQEESRHLPTHHTPLLLTLRSLYARDLKHSLCWTMTMMGIIFNSSASWRVGIHWPVHWQNHAAATNFLWRENSRGTYRDLPFTDGYFISSQSESSPHGRCWQSWNSLSPRRDLCRHWGKMNFNSESLKLSI